MSVKVFMVCNQKLVDFRVIGYKCNKGVWPKHMYTNNLWKTRRYYLLFSFLPISLMPSSMRFPCLSNYGKWKDKSRWLGTNQWYLSHCKATKNIIISIIIFSDIYKVLDDVLGQGAHTIVKSCVKLVTNQEYAVKVGNYFLWLLPERGTAILWVILVCAAMEVMVFKQFGLG